MLTSYVFLDCHKRKCRMSSVTTQTMITARCIRNGSRCRKSSIITMRRESSILCQHAVVCCWSPATEFLSTKL